MNWIQELIETTGSKIRSPVLGSVLFSFVVANWKVLFFLSFADKSVIDKFIYFDQNSSFWSLFLIPVVAGLVLSFINPWVKLVALKFTKKPIQNARIEQMKLSHERLMKKQELEEARRSIVASVEEDLIAAAKRDQEILAIENEELREKLQDAVNNARLEGNPDSNNEYEIYTKEFERLKSLIKYFEERRETAYQDSELSKANELSKKISNLETQIDNLSNATHSKLDI